MATCESPMSPGARLSRQGPLTRSLSPGTAGARLNFSLGETAILQKPMPRAAEARKQVQSHSADPLGLRGPTWNSSVEQRATKSSKYGREQADNRLSNSLRPEHINAADFRTSKARFQPGASAPAEFNRGTREWGITAYDWNPSVSTETPEEAARRREAHTQHCQSATQRATLRMMQRNYKGPVAAQVQRMEDMRQQKADGNINYAALVEEYGPEGADHMVQIIKMKREKAERTAGFVMPPRRHAPKQKIPKQDIEAVNALPGDDNEDNS